MKNRKYIYSKFDGPEKPRIVTDISYIDLLSKISFYLKTEHGKEYILQLYPNTNDVINYVESRCCTNCTKWGTNKCMACEKDGCSMKDEPINKYFESK